MSPAKARSKHICCKAWMDLAATQREQWKFQALHQYGHSRTSFSVETFAFSARVPVPEAVQLIADAELRKWLWTPQEGVWVGRLTPRR